MNFKKLSRSENVVLASETTDLKVIKELAKEKSEKILIALVKNPCCPDELAYSLRFHRNNDLRAELAHRYSFTSNQLEFFKNDVADVVLGALAGNWNTEPNTLVELAARKNRNVFREAIANRSLPVWYLTKVSESREGQRRADYARAVIRNPNCPKELLIKYLAFGNGELIEEILKSPQSDEDVRSEILKLDLQSFNRLVLCDSGTSADLIYEYFLGIVSNPLDNSHHGVNGKIVALFDHYSAKRQPNVDKRVFDLLKYRILNGDYSFYVNYNFFSSPYLEESFLREALDLKLEDTCAGISRNPNAKDEWFYQVYDIPVRLIDEERLGAILEKTNCRTATSMLPFDGTLGELLELVKAVEYESTLK